MAGVEQEQTRSEKPSEPWVIGVDLGGTKIAVGAVNRQGQVLARTVLPTPVSDGPQSVLAAIAEGMRQIAAGQSTPPAAVGLASPGPMDNKTGVAVAAANVGWYDFPVSGPLQSRFGWPIYLENDANAAALGEWAFGAGRGVENLIYVTISTGIGMGAVLHGRLYQGSHFTAGEAGHMVLVPDGPLCTCGERGCWEALASGTAITREAREAVARHPESLLAALAGGDPLRVSVAQVGEAVRRGDPVAQEVWERAVHYLEIGFTNLANLFDPDLFVVGGGVTNLSDLFLGRVEGYINAHANPGMRGRLKMVRAGLSSDSGVLGAAAVAWQGLPSESWVEQARQEAV